VAARVAAARVAAARVAAARVVTRAARARATGALPAAACWATACSVAAMLFAAPCAGADPPAAPAKAQVCAGCHGAAGLAGNPLMPSINGQPRQFIATELFQFREGHRQNEMMSPMAAGMENQELNALAAYFAAQPPDPPSHKSDPQKAERAKQLTKQLNCVSCHGPALMGQQHIPRLAGQQYEYVRAQLRGFKATTRADIDGLMTSAAQPLSDEDIDAVADYVAGLAP